MVRHNIVLDARTIARPGLFFDNGYPDNLALGAGNHDQIAWLDRVCVRDDPDGFALG